MTDTTEPLPPPLRRVLGLLADPPADPDVPHGYLDLLGAQAAAPDAGRNTGAIQAVWASALGSLFYDNAQSLARRLVAAWQHPAEWLDLEPGRIVLDVGCGPGSITGSLARAVWPEGLAVGVDVSAPMLTRAVRDARGARAAFVRADAQQLPLREDTVDAVVSIAALQLIPDPRRALAEMHRVLRPGGRLAVMVPTAGRAQLLGRLLPQFGAHIFAEDELGDLAEELGFTGVRVKSAGAIQWVRGSRG